MTDEWVEWHRQYGTDGPLQRRLEVVRTRIRAYLDACPNGPIRVLSLCAGDGRDLLGVLRDHARAPDVRGRLIDASPTLSARGRRRAAALTGGRLEFRCGDASTTSAAEGAAPADLLLLCGIFGNIADADIRTTIRQVSMLCAPGATIVWTRGRGKGDITPRIRRWLRAAGFEESSFDAIPGAPGTVGVNRLVTRPKRYRAGVKLFTFLPRRQRASRTWAKRPQQVGGSRPTARAGTRTPRPTPHRDAR